MSDVVSEKPVSRRKCRNGWLPVIPMRNAVARSKNRIASVNYWFAQSVFWQMAEFVQKSELLSQEEWPKQPSRSNPILFSPKKGIFSADRYEIMLEENMIKLAKLGAMIDLANLDVERLSELNIWLIGLWFTDRNRFWETLFQALKKLSDIKN